MGDGPYYWARSGCGGYRMHTRLAPTPCPLPPVWAGVIYFPSPPPGAACWTFTCDAHRDNLTGARELLERDRAELRRRRDNEQSGLKGGPYVPTKPLATGAAAKRLMRRLESAGR